MFAQIAKKTALALCAAATLFGAQSASARIIIVKEITPAGGLVWQGGGVPCTNGPGYCRRFVVVAVLRAPNPKPPIDYTKSDPVYLYTYPARGEAELGVTGDLPVPKEYIPEEGQEIIPTKEIRD